MMLEDTCHQLLARVQKACPATEPNPYASRTEKAASDIEHVSFPELRRELQFHLQQIEGRKSIRYEH